MRTDLQRPLQDLSTAIEEYVKEAVEEMREEIEDLIKDEVDALHRTLDQSAHDEEG